MTTESDRELLEAAARAYWDEEIDDVCSIRWLEVDQAIGYTHGDNQDHNGEDREFVWNPLRDDADALRLAVKLLIDVDQGEIGTTNGKPAAIAHYRFTLKSGQIVWNSRSELHGDDPYAATRRAIVRAAAAIGAHKEGD